MEPPLYYDYYSTDPVQKLTKQFIPQHIHQPRPQPPLVFTNEWHQHSLYSHHSFLPSDNPPRIKQEELGGFSSYPHQHQPRNYDALNLPQQHHLISNASSLYPNPLSPLQTATISQHSQHSIYYPSQSMQHHQQRRFSTLQQHQQPAYHPQAYSGGTVHAAETHPTADSLSPLVDYTDQAIAGCDPHFVSVETNAHPDTHSTPQQDGMKAPLSHTLEGWDDDRRRSLTSLVESQLEMVDMDMNDMNVMIGVGGVVEDTVGEEDAEGEDEWDEIEQQQQQQQQQQQPYLPQYMNDGQGEVDRSECDPHMRVEHQQVNDEGDVDSFDDDYLLESEESEEDDNDTEFVLKTKSSRKGSVQSSSHASDPGFSHTAGEGRNSRPRSQPPRYNPYATRSATGTRRRSQPGSSPSTSSLPIPIPVPNLTKKSRGRRVPTMSSLEDIRSAASGAGKKRQSMGGKSARMYLCEVEGCGKCFARGEHLKRHVRSIHTYEKRDSSPISSR